MLSLHTLGKYKGCRMGRGGGSLSLTLAPIDRQVFVPWVLNVQTPSPPVPKRAVYGRTWDVESIGRTYVVTLGDGQWYAARGQQGSVSPGARPGRAPVLREELEAEGRSESWGSAAPTIRRRSLVKLLLDRRRGDGGVNTTQTRVLTHYRDRLITGHSTGSHGRREHTDEPVPGGGARCFCAWARATNSVPSSSAHARPLVLRQSTHQSSPGSRLHCSALACAWADSITCVLLSSPLSRDGVLSCGLTTPYSPHYNQATHNIAYIY